MFKSRYKLFISLVAVLTFLPVIQAQAFGGSVVCVNCATVGQGTTIIAYLQTLIGGQQTQTTAITTAELRNTKALVQQMNSNLAAQGKMMSSLASSIRKGFKEQAAALGEQNTNSNFGPAGKSFTIGGIRHRVTSVPLNTCQTTARAAASGAGIPRTDRFGMNMERALSQYNNKYPNVTKAVNRFKHQNKNDYKAQWLMGDNSSLTTKKQQKAARAWVKNVTNPVPSPKLKPKSKAAKSKSGKNYKRLRKTMLSHIKVAQNALSQLMAEKAATVPVGKTVKRQWQAISPNKKIKTNKNGDVSPLFVLRTEANYRYASKKWHSRLQDLQPKAQRTEALKMQSINTKINFKRYQLERLQTAMMAIRTAGYIHNRMGPKVRHARKVVRQTFH